MPAADLAVSANRLNRARGLPLVPDMLMVDTKHVRTCWRLWRRLLHLPIYTVNERTPFMRAYSRGQPRAGKTLGAASGAIASARTGQHHLRAATDRPAPPQSLEPRDLRYSAEQSHCSNQALTPACACVAL